MAFDKPLNRKIPDHFLVFANQDYSLSLTRFLRNDSTEGWYFFQGEEGNIGTMFIVRVSEYNRHVLASFTQSVDKEKITEYLMDFLTTVGIIQAFVTVHEGNEVATFDFEA